MAGPGSTRSASGRQVSSPVSASQASIQPGQHHAPGKSEFGFFSYLSHYFMYLHDWIYHVT
ncbi:MAG: hypothetical protein EA363_02440 [Balneolaceae bacterium]|nr:MAG: hypothetical protein EA363_02440 [Balneolaceae bacterium]